jgi:transposase
MDRPAGGARAARAHPLPRQAGRLADLGQGADPRRDGQARDPSATVGDVRSDRPGAVGRHAVRGRYAIRVESLRDLLEIYERELALVERALHSRLADHKGYTAIQALKGVGRVTAAIMVAEIGEVGRFPDARHLCSWAGLTPTHRESDTKVHRGHISKQGSTLVRWAAIEAVARYHGGAPIAPAFMRIAKRRGVMIARVAAARKLLGLIFYGLRDGEIRCLAREAG